MPDILLPYIYFYTFFIILLLLSLLFCGIRNNDKVFYLAVIVILAFVGFRDEYVGTDTITYVDFFHHKDFYYHDKPTDLFFEFVGRALHFFNDTTPFFIFSTSLLGLFGIYFIIYKISLNRVLSLFLFLTSGTAMTTFFLYFSMVRQCIAITFFLMAVYFLFESERKNKYILTAIFYLMAILTHGSCLITAPIVALVYYRPIRNKQVWFLLIAFTYYLASLNISLVSSILGFVFSRIGENKYEGYADVSFGMIDAKGFFNMNLLPYVCVSCFVIAFVSKKMLAAWYIQLFLYSTLLNNVFFDNLMWSRLVLYFSLFIIVALPNVYENMRYRAKLIPLFFFLIYFLYKDFSELIMNAVFPSGNIIVPYESVLF